MIIVGYRYDIIGSQLVIAIREREREILYFLILWIASLVAITQQLRQDR